MQEARQRVIAWVGREILPHEADVRAWLCRSQMPAPDVEDVIQEAYCRLSGLSEVGHVANPRAYFFTVTRNVVMDHVRRARVVRMETVAEIESLNIIWDSPSPERITAARRELERVRGLISRLPERCRRIFEMRKIEGLSQREIALKMGVSETIVENDRAWPAPDPEGDCRGRRDRQGPGRTQSEARPCANPQTPLMRAP